MVVGASTGTILGGEGGEGGEGGGKGGGYAEAFIG